MRLDKTIGGRSRKFFGNSIRYRRDLNYENRYVNHVGNVDKMNNALC